MKLSLLIPALALLTACGNHTKVEYCEVDRATLTAISGDASTLGYAWWKDKKYEVECRIYVMPAYKYETQECYDETVRHELRHCYEFQYHPEGVSIEPACATVREAYLLP